MGIRRGATWYLKNSNTDGPADMTFIYGLSSDLPVRGDWDQDGDDTQGIYRGGMWYVSNTVGNTTADLSFSFGAAGDTPLVWR